MSPTLRAALALTLALCIQPAAQAQAPNPETALRAQLLNRRFILHNMSAATDINGTWDGQTLTLDPAPWHIFAMLTIHKVKLKGNKLKIEATRNQLLRNATDKFSFNPLSTEVDLTLTLQGDPATLAPTLPGALFLSTIGDALAVIPRPFTHSIPPYIGAPPPFKKDQRICDCASPAGTCTIVKDSGMGRPQVLQQVPPKFSDEAKSHRFSGNAEIGILLDGTGAITGQWIIRELPFGLDQEATTAVSQYKFAPATCHNQPVSTSIFVEVNFQIL